MAGFPLAGRVDARAAVMAVCVVLGGGAAAGLGLMTGGCTAPETRAVLQAGVAAVAVANDLNGDGALDRGEVTAMVERSFPIATRTGPGWDTVRALLVASYMGQDRDGDGRLTMAELLAVPAPVPPPVDETAAGFVAVNRAE